MSDRLERLINLVIALREARVPMTSAEIRERVAGYGQADHEAFRRMFERDKSDLRALGVPLRTAYTDRLHDREGYRIRPEDYDLEPLELQPDELAALALAVQVTGVDERHGLRKLEADAGGVADGPDGPASVAVALGAPHRDALLAAQLRQRRVRFTYRPPGREPQARTVDPAGLVHRGGHWYVVGHDADRDARRAFRLDRIAGEVAEVGDADAREGPVSVEDVLPEGDPVEAEIAASHDAAWLVARRARGAGRALADGRSAYTLPARDADELLGWLLRLGGEVEVLGPPDFRARIAGALDRLAQGRA